MKTFVSALAVAAVAFTGCRNDFTQAGRARGAGGSDDLIVRAHFIGSEQLLKDTNAAKLKEVWNLKASAELRKEALDRFAHLPFLWLSNSLPANSPNQAALFRAVLDDALANESFIEWRATPSICIVARLSEARAKAWDTNLRQAMTAWKLGNPATFDRDGRKGWELSQDWSAPDAFRARRRLGRCEHWGGRLGPRKQSLRAHQSSAPRDRRLARRRRQCGAVQESPAAAGAFREFADGPFLVEQPGRRCSSTLVQLDFPRPHNWKAEPWQIPTNMIWDPIMDFTVVRGIAGVLDALPFIHNLGWQPTPNQICGWGNTNLPFQLCYAAPAQNVNSQLKRIEPKLRAELLGRDGTNLQGTISWDTNQMELIWRGFPLAAPALSLVKDGEKEFVSLKFFPMAKMKERPPAELFEQFAGRNDVVMYDWESTQFRIPTWRQAYQLAEIASNRQLSPENVPAQQWQSDVGTLLGDAVTEVRATSPTQMTVVRKSTIGLTAFELVTLSRWIESTNFPAFGTFPPQPARRIPPRGNAPKPK